MPNTKTHDHYYQRAIKWIAENDETTELDATKIVDLISVVLVADVFGYTPRRVANDVMRIRRQIR